MHTRSMERNPRICKAHPEACTGGCEALFELGIDIMATTVDAMTSVRACEANASAFDAGEQMAQWEMDI